MIFEILQIWTKYTRLEQIINSNRCLSFLRWMDKKMRKTWHFLEVLFTPYKGTFTLINHSNDTHSLYIHLETYWCSHCVIVEIIVEQYLLCWNQNRRWRVWHDVVFDIKTPFWIRCLWYKLCDILHTIFNKVNYDSTVSHSLFTIVFVFMS